MKAVMSYPVFYIIIGILMGWFLERAWHLYVWAEYKAEKCAATIKAHRHPWIAVKSFEYTNDFPFEWENGVFTADDIIDLLTNVLPDQKGKLPEMRAQPGNYDIHMFLSCRFVEREKSEK
jgi:hypothetical protein